MDRRCFLTLATGCAALALPHTVWPDPAPYELGPDSEVRFTYLLAGVPSRGTIPVRTASLTLDFRDVARSRIAVELDATAARTTLPLADIALRGESVLATDRFPTIRFDSTSVQRTDTGARMQGRLTIRDQTRIVTLDASLFRQPDRDPTDLRDLVLTLRGAISRSAFGAVGYPDLVADRLEIEILARISRFG